MKQRRALPAAMALFLAASSTQAQAPAQPICNKGDLKDCESKCAKDTPSCGAAGFLKFKNGDIKGAVTLLGKACDANLANYCLTLGQIQAQDNGKVKKNEAGAVKAFTRACDGDIGKACQSLAPFYWNGKGGVKKDDAKALEYLVKACGLQFPQACGLAAHEYHSTKRNPDALTYANKGCQANDPESCVMTGVLNPDRKAALAIYTKLCAATQYKKACDFKAALEKPEAPPPTDDEDARGASGAGSSPAPAQANWNPEKDKCDDKIAHDKNWAWCDERECRSLLSFNNCGKCNVACHASGDECKLDSYGYPKCFSGSTQAWYDP
jgi:hypothetical protein